MPAGDRTGPMGMGPMTGRAAGYCAGYPVPGYMNPYGGRLGGAFGWGRGRWWQSAYSAPYRAISYSPFLPYPSRPFAFGAYGAGLYQPPYSAEQEREFLQNQAKALEDQLDAVRERISEIEAEMEKRKEEEKKSQK